MIELHNVTKKYKNKTVIDQLSLKVETGDFLCIYGESGSGKTTLLNIMGLLEKLDDGEIIFDGQKNLSKKVVNDLQRNKIGYVFQNFGLLTNEKVKDNLMIALKKDKIKKSQAEQLMLESLKEVYLPDVLDKKIFELSGGEQQRVALARLILKKPEYIFADEPTGNLDEKNSDMVFEILKKFNKENHATVVFVTHNKKFIDLAEKSLKI